MKIRQLNYFNQLKFFIVRLIILLNNTKQRHRAIPGGLLGPKLNGHLKQSSKTIGNTLMVGVVCFAYFVRVETN